MPPTDTLIKEFAERLMEAAQESRREKRRLRVRQIEMWLRWRYNHRCPLPFVAKSAELVAEAPSRALEIARHLLDHSYTSGPKLNLPVEDALLAAFERSKCNSVKTLGGGL
jgi:hypothetical protein